METSTARPTVRTRRGQLRSGAWGCLIGTAFGLMWFCLGQSAVHGTGRPVVLGAGAVVFLASALGVVHLFRTAARTPEGQRGTAVPAEGGAGGPRFVTVVITEAVVLGVGSNVLRTVLHHPELMLCWSALVVGVHFFPMARTLRAPVLRVVGALMVATIGLAVLASLLPGATDAVWQAVPGLGCAAVLWGGALRTAVRARRAAGPDA